LVAARSAVAAERRPMENRMRAPASIITFASVLTLFGEPLVNADALRLKAHIWFDFTAGTTRLPAGTYAVTRMDGSDGVFLLRGAKASAFLAMERAESGPPTDRARLVFHRYGDRYFLREVWFSGTRGYPLQEAVEERGWADGRNGSVASIPVTVPAGVGRE
jgi:hypothetical protein